MGFEVRNRAFLGALGNLQARLGPEAQAALEEHGRRFSKRFRTEAFERYPGPGREDPRRTRPYTRSRALANSARSEVFGQGLDSRLRLSIGGNPNNPGARIQEYGGTVTPKSAKYLTIPLPANLTPAGRLRRSARDLLSDKETGAFFLRSKAGNLLIARDKNRGREGSDPNLEFLFVLKKRVVIPARLGFRRAIRSERTALDRQALLNEGIRRALRRSFGSSGQGGRAA